jgi:hypothetical protein
MANCLLADGTAPGATLPPNIDIKRRQRDKPLSHLRLSRSDMIMNEQ